MSTCTFQYATGNGCILEDKGLISMNEALKLFNKYLPIFKDHMTEGKEPEMAIWIGMKNTEDFHTTHKHYHYSDMRMIDGNLYKLIPVD